jgi:hypothetical protein
VVVVRPAVAGAPVVAGRVVMVGSLAASGVVSGVVVDGARAVLGWRGRVVVVDAAVGAGSVPKVDRMPGWLGVGGGGSWGARAAVATKATRTQAVSPEGKQRESPGLPWRLQMPRGSLGHRCCGPCSIVPSALGLPIERAVPPAPDVAPHNRSNGAFMPVERMGTMEPHGGGGRRDAGEPGTACRHRRSTARHKTARTTPPAC